MITQRELLTSLRTLGLERDIPILAHVSLDALGPLNGGVEAILNAFLSSFDTLLMPVFTRRTELIPEVGPADNGLLYGSGRISNANAEFFRSDMPSDRAMGAAAESLRRLPQAQRSVHPILSFAGVKAEKYITSQSLAEPLAPLQALLEAGGWVLLLGVDQTVNISLHLAESQVGRKQFLRWALTPFGVIECPGMPGCSQGFNAIASRLRRVTRQVQTGEAILQAVSLVDLIGIARGWLETDPLALLCDQPDCAMCQAVRAQALRV
jgi:aminoglycoside 3-N-acetyltransferase